MEINVDADNLVLYQRAELQLEVPYIRGCAKITISDIYDSEQYKLSQSQNMSILGPSTQCIDEKLHTN
jgi:hypothetical protein